MSCYSGPEIANSNLVLSYDPANLKSYNPAENLYTDSENSTLWSNADKFIYTSSNILPASGPTSGYYIVSNNQSNNYLQSSISYVTATPSFYTHSIYCKAGTQNIVSLILGTNSYNTAVAGGLYFRVMFNMTTKTFYNPQLAVATGVTITIDKFTYNYVDLGNGWFRFYVIGDLTTATNISWVTGGFYIGEYGNTIAAYNTGVYATGMMLQSSNGLIPYIKTTSAAITKPTTVSDITGNGITGTLMNAPIYNSAGYFKYTYTSSHYINVPANSNYNFLGTAPYTLEAWIYPTRNPGAANYTGIFDRESNPGSGRDGYNLYFLGSAGTTTYLIAERFCSGVNTNAGITLDQSVSVNNWHHIVVTYDSNRLKIYRNGLFAGYDAASTGSITNTTKNLTIGLRGTYFDGRIALTNIYSSALTASQILQNFNSLKSRFGF